MEQDASLENWAKLAANNTEKALTKSLFNAILLNSKAFDVFSSWFLLVTGAILTLLVSNLELLRCIVSPFAVILFFFLMLASAIFGVIAKYLSILIETFCNISRTIEEDFPQIMSNFEIEKEKIMNIAKQTGKQIEVNIVLGKVLYPVIEQYPKLFHRFLWKSAEQGKSDPFLNYKKAVKYLLSRSIYIGIQILLFILGFLFFVNNITL